MSGTQFEVLGMVLQNTVAPDRLLRRGARCSQYWPALKLDVPAGTGHLLTISGHVKGRMFKLQLGMRIEETVAEDVWMLGILVLLRTSQCGRWEIDVMFRLPVASALQHREQSLSWQPPVRLLLKHQFISPDTDDKIEMNLSSSWDGKRT